MAEISRETRVYFHDIKTASGYHQLLEKLITSKVFKATDIGLTKAQINKISKPFKEVESLGIEVTRNELSNDGVIKLSFFSGSTDNEKKSLQALLKSLTNSAAKCSYTEVYFDSEKIEEEFLIGRKKVKFKDFFDAIVDINYQLALELAVRKNYISDVKKLLRQNIDPNVFVDNQSLLYHAFKYVDKRAIQDLLLSAGANPNSGNL